MNPAGARLYSAGVMFEGRWREHLPRMADRAAVLTTVNGSPTNAGLRRTDQCGVRRPWFHTTAYTASHSAAPTATSSRTITSQMLSGRRA